MIAHTINKSLLFQAVGVRVRVRIRIYREVLLSHLVVSTATAVAYAV